MKNKQKTIEGQWWQQPTTAPSGYWRWMPRRWGRERGRRDGCQLVSNAIRKKTFLLQKPATNKREEEEEMKRSKKRMREKPIVSRESTRERERNGEKKEKTLNASCGWLVGKCVYAPSWSKPLAPSPSHLDLLFLSLSLSLSPAWLQWASKKITNMECHKWMCANRDGENPTRSSIVTVSHGIRCLSLSLHQPARPSGAGTVLNESLRSLYIQFPTSFPPNPTPHPLKNCFNLQKVDEERSSYIIVDINLNILFHQSGFHF